MTYLDYVVHTADRFLVNIYNMTIYTYCMWAIDHASGCMSAPDYLNDLRTVAQVSWVG